MSPRPQFRSSMYGGEGVLAPSSSGASKFAVLAAQMAAQPLHEFCPAGAGAEPAALGFALGLAAAWAGPPGVIWAGQEGLFAEEGAPYPPGLAQFGLDPRHLIVVRAGKREETLWAAEQGLSAAGAVVICALSGRGGALDLKATRRLLLFAEHNHARCLLLRPLAGPSAAWTRWCVSPAPSQAHGREVGAPAYRAELVRRRAGPSGAVFTLDWNADGRCFDERMAGDCSAASFDGQTDPIRLRS